MHFDWQKIELEQIITIALEAGSKIMDIYHNEDFSKIVDFKADNSPLTLADKESNLIIERGLTELSSIPFLSEEGRDIPYEERKDWNCFWIVDPLDGTKEFIKRNGQFTVNIALVEHSKPVIGVIYAPAFDLLYYARKGGGAFKREKGKSFALSTNKKDKDWIAVGSGSHASPEENEVLKQYPVVQSIPMGSSLKFCVLAEGKGDIYYRYGPTMEWDTAAGQAILENSGGKVLDVNHQPFTYNKKSLTNGSFLCLGHRDY